MKRLAAIVVLFAAPVAADPVVHRLSPDAAAAAVAGGAERNRAAEALALDRDSLDGDAPARRVHGEVGFGLGTGGGREAFGTVVAPLGETGTAAFSYDYARDAGRGYGYAYPRQRR